MPDNMFVHTNSVKTAIQYFVGHGQCYYDQSLVVKYQINNVPLKVDVDKHPEMKNIMNNPANSFDIVYPSGMIDINIGSNVGLVSIIRKLYEQHGMNDDSCNRYLTLNVDENIYYRILKVIYILVNT